MADEVLLVKKESLESVADAIREKSGSSQELEFPEGFVEAIQSNDKKWSNNDIGIATYNSSTGYISPIDGDVVVNGYIGRPFGFYYTAIKSIKMTFTGNISGWTVGERYCSFCHELEDVLYNPPSNGIGGIATYAFWDCKKLKRVRITGNITYIGGSAPFGNCPNLTDIYVTWAEGAISGAPWGATNATIHYNTIFDENGDVVT